MHLHRCLTGQLGKWTKLSLQNTAGNYAMLEDHVCATAKVAVQQT